MRLAHVPPLGAALPRRFGSWTRVLGAVVLGVAGWTLEGTLPDLPKLVVIVAPHTSNWDFPLGLAVIFALGVRVRWLGKHTLFRRPFGALFRWLGGIPVRRGERLGATDAAVAAIAANERIILALAPEGTRRHVPTWKTGYYAIAERAAVPIVPVWFDYARRVVGFGPPVNALGGADALTAELRARYYRKEMARRPENY